MNAFRAARVRFGRRIDALSLRERAIMAVSLAAALAAAVDFTVLTPQWAAQRAAVQRLRSQGAELAPLRAQIAGKGESPAVALQRQVAERQSELAALDARIAERLAGHADAARLPDLLERVLRRHDRLTLMKLETLPQGDDATAHRRSVELKIAGRFADLAAYTAEIERQLPGLQWSTFAIEGQAEPPLLQARVWLVGAGS